ncbi:MAG: MOSC domain-containing protein [Acidobacteriota bacterium]|nr:hypothetical protein [Actinomycetota bacterium]
MKEIVATLVSVHVGNNEDLSKEAQPSVKAELDGFAGDKHRGFERQAFAGEAEPVGTVRRNDRQWSGVSVEELVSIEQRMDLKEPLTAATLGANICVRGVTNFSQLPKGTRLVFPSGAVLLIEGNNPPCVDMGAQIAAKHTTNSREPVTGTLFPKHSAGLRGVVGVVDVPGIINAGDQVTVQVYEPPASE